MGKLRIIADGNSPQAQANARGKLFEHLMAKVLRHYGYSIDSPPNVNYSGMEIDIEGRSIATRVPLYAECKCYDTEVDSPKFQAFYGKYMAKWLKDRRSQGLFIALPGINNHAKGFYRDNCENNSDVTIRLLQEEDVLRAILGMDGIATSEIISANIPVGAGTPGDWLILYSDRGLLWLQYIIPIGGTLASKVAVFDANGIHISDKTTLDYLTRLAPEIGELDIILPLGAANVQISTKQDVEEIVEVRGSSECFEYQFPASPQYFVGRQLTLQALDLFVDKVLNKDISSRGVLFEANSGWGKSSAVLASVARLREKGHFAIAVDCRSASSSQFILRVVNYALGAFGDFDGLFSAETKSTALTGFDGALDTLLRIAQVLEQNGKIMLIFLDQFENVFFLPEALKRIADVLLKLCDSQSNVILGFSWKTDLIGLHSEFPYQFRDLIMTSSKRITLEPFSEPEATDMIMRLSLELKARLRKDLVFLLHEFSQGYPWLLKKLCAHVKGQLETGVHQAEIANGLLNVEELFKEDLRGLTPQQEEALKRIAKSAPISVSEFGDELQPEVVQTLVNRRLVIRIGPKFDIYWDIFRDYLNRGSLPVQENYMLRMQTGSVLKATRIIVEANGVCSVGDFQKRARLSEKTLYNLVRDMRLLGIAEIENGKIILLVNTPNGSKDFEISLRLHLRDTLPRNRLVRRLKEKLDSEGLLNTDQISETLAKWCPYISASNRTWQTYARVFADWMDLSDLGIFDRQRGELTQYTPGTEVRQRQIPISKGRSGMNIPCVQYRPVEKASLRLVQALEKGGRIDWKGFNRSTVGKALITLEDLELIAKKSQSISVQPKLKLLVTSPDIRSHIFAEAVMKIPAFTVFVQILERYKNSGRSLRDLAMEFRDRMKTDWRDATVETHVKIMLDWARHTKLAPGVFAETHRGKKYSKSSNSSQKSLFSGLERE